MKIYCEQAQSVTNIYTQFVKVSEYAARKSVSVLLWSGSADQYTAKVHEFVCKSFRSYQSKVARHYVMDDVRPRCEHAPLNIENGLASGELMIVYGEDFPF